MLNSVSDLHWTPTFEWFMVACESKKQTSKNIFVGIRLDLYDRLLTQKKFNLSTNDIFIHVLKFMREVAMGMIWCANHLGLIACSVSYKKCE